MREVYHCRAGVQRRTSVPKRKSDFGSVPDMDSFRAPFFWLAIFALALAVIVEFFSPTLLSPGVIQNAVNQPTPGWGIQYLAILDLLLIYGALEIGLGLLLPRG